MDKLFAGWIALLLMAATLFTIFSGGNPFMFVPVAFVIYMLFHIFKAFDD